MLSVMNSSVRTRLLSTTGNYQDSSNTFLDAGKIIPLSTLLTLHMINLITVITVIKPGCVVEFICVDVCCTVRNTVLRHHSTVCLTVVASVASVPVQPHIATSEHWSHRTLVLPHRTRDCCTNNILLVSVYFHLCCCSVCSDVLFYNDVSVCSERGLMMRGWRRGMS